MLSVASYCLLLVQQNNLIPQSRLLSMHYIDKVEVVVGERQLNSEQPLCHPCTCTVLFDA